MAIPKIQNMPSVLDSTVDDGTKEVKLFNKFGQLICTVHIRVSDVSIMDRYNALMKDIETIAAPLRDLSIRNDGTSDFEEDWPKIKEVEEILKRKLRELFDTDETDGIFAKRNPFSSVGGHFFFELVLTALGNLIKNALEEEAKLASKRLSKYLKDTEAVQPEVSANAGAPSANA